MGEGLSDQYTLSGPYYLVPSQRGSDSLDLSPLLELLPGQACPFYDPGGGWGGWVTKRPHLTAMVSEIGLKPSGR